MVFELGPPGPERGNLHSHGFLITVTGRARASSLLNGSDAGHDFTGLPLQLRFSPRQDRTLGIDFGPIASETVEASINGAQCRLFGKVSTPMAQLVNENVLVLEGEELLQPCRWPFRWC